MIDDPQRPILGLSAVSGCIDEAMKGVVTPCEVSQSFDRNSDHYLHLHTTFT